MINKAGHPSVSGHMLDNIISHCVLSLYQKLLPCAHWQIINRLLVGLHIMASFTLFTMACPVFSRIAFKSFWSIFSKFLEVHRTQNNNVQLDLSMICIHNEPYNWHITLLTVWRRSELWSHCAIWKPMHAPQHLENEWEIEKSLMLHYDRLSHFKGP